MGSSDDMDDFLAFMARRMGRDAVDSRTPADLEHVEQFVALAGWPLPPLYLGYLKAFGGGGGGLKAFDDGDGRVATLIEAYENPGPDFPAVPQDGVLISVNNLCGDHLLVFPKASCCDCTAALEEPQVMLAFGETRFLWARSFRNHLYRQAFVQGCKAPVWCRLHRMDMDLLEEAQEALARFGFVPWWFSDDRQVCLERSDGATVYCWKTLDRTAMVGHFPDSQARDALAQHLVSRLGLIGT